MYKITFKSEGGTYSFISKANSEYKALKDLSNRSEESKNDTFDSWIADLEETEQPNACSIDNPDCENCGS